MFGRMMNNYYYGKSGKGDFRKEDMPENRWQLFRDMLKTRLGSLVRLNLIYMVAWIPTMIVLSLFWTNLIQGLQMSYVLSDKNELEAYIQERVEQNSITEEQIKALRETDGQEFAGYYSQQELPQLTLKYLLILIPCIALTGPFTAGVSYVVRNWARDEHAFMWTDFKDAVRDNWKYALAVSSLTGLAPAVVYVCWEFYGRMESTNSLMFVPKMLVVLIAILWALSVTYMHPMEVTYDVKLKGVIKNGLLFGVARLPMSVGIRLLHCVPAAISALLAFLWNPFAGMFFLIIYYFLIGFSLSRFITASYTNAVFDKYINSRIEGAKVNQGLRDMEDEDDEEEALPDESATKDVEQ